MLRTFLESVMAILVTTLVALQVNPETGFPYIFTSFFMAAVFGFLFLITGWLIASLIEQVHSDLTNDD